jgi:RimJ/RimL family protein N-acetyltransferase
MLTTRRLVLRDFRESDWEAVREYQSDPCYLRFNPWTERTEAEVRAFVQRFLDQQSEEPRTRFQLALVLKEEDRLIGNCGIRVHDPALREAEIGYEIAPRHWGKGYATEAASEILRFGFEELELHRITAWCVAENLASARVLEKIGMRPEGHLREKEFFKGRWWDQRIFAILDCECQAPPRR